MLIDDMFAAWKKIISEANLYGIPIPMVRYKGEGNPALTLVVVSATIVVVGLLSKWAGMLGGVDLTMAMQFFYASSSLFFGHSLINRPSNGDPGSN
jgi:hypothetical protein